ncbi:MAG: hypothetical protein J6Y07_03825 [Alphaproteobacteria bacterium]|nr:hypothetical protein [Alphaproteobacteria bacterium]
MKIFNIVVGAILCALPITSHATEECTFFSPALALCSVHAYNVGDAENPTDTGRATDIENVIALKSTFMVQQLKQQYDKLNTVIKRLKTQLNKAVLTSKIEVLTGNTSSSSNSSSGGSNSNNTVSISGASDCSTYSGTANIAQCLQPNIQLIINTANSGKITEARNQLIKDMNTATTWKLCDKEQTQTACCSAIKGKDITQAIKGMNAANLISCANEFRAAIVIKMEENNNKNRNNYSGWGANNNGG